MNKKILSAVLSLTIAASAFGGFASAVNAAEAKTPKYQTKARQMEKLNRGLIAVKNANGVYLSWRVFGDEDLAATAYDIYREGTAAPIATINGGQASNYTDKNGLVTNKYKVVVSGATAQEIEAEPWTTPQQTKGDTTWTYFDVPISKPTDIAHANTTALSDYTRTNNVGGANDASLGDLDGDGDYEIVLKWDPKNSKDSASGNTTGHCVFDAYEIDPNNGGYMWRIDIGNNIAAGAHYSQFMVYDFDGDGKAEIATITAPGSYSLVKNDAGGYEKIYVTSVGDTEDIRNADNNATKLRKGNNNGPEYYTIFDGETGRPLRTTEAIPLGDETGSAWGDSKMNRSSRYLAAVAYLDGVTPYYVPIRGMYNRTILRAYTWDGENLTLVKEHNGNKKGETMYGEGNHNLSVADIDNDGKDEIVYGSACLDDDFKTVLGNTKMGHGDAMHVSDFNNDGVTEVFSVKEDKEGWSRGIDFRVAKTGAAIWSKKVTADNGRGAMDNIDDAYAATHPDALALGWDAFNADAYDFKGNAVAAKPNGNSRRFCNFLVYWDDDLGRELLDDTQMAKYNASKGVTDRIFFNGQGYLPGNSNNSTKQTPSLVADLWGDWREEIIMPADNDTVLRIMTPTAPTQYRLATLMHDSQYRLAIAWQNVGYNQPPHTSYYIGSAALATDADGNKLNYLAPEMPYTKVIYPTKEQVDVTGVAIEEDEITVEKGKTVSLNASVIPENATKKGIEWTTSNASVATVANGIVRGVGPGTATITATTKEGGLTDTCTVTVFENPVKKVLISEEVINLGIGNTMNLTAKPVPSDASDTAVKWTSDDPSVAEVDDGTVTGKGYGKTLVKAEIGGVTAQCIVKVKPIDIVDATGENVFESSNADGETIKLEKASAIGGTLNHKAASAGGEFHKDFQVYDSNTATLTFHFTTGGQKDASGAWKWAGREYTLNMALLDSEGNNIITVAQPYASGGAGSMTSKVRDEEAVSFDSNWSGERGDIQGSAKRWIVTFEFDYDNDICNASIIGTDSTWETINGNKTKTFSLNGASFKTLKFYTESNNGGLITANPMLEALTYISTEQVSGETDVLYEKGTENKPWAETDVEDWTQEGKDAATLVYEDGRILYNPVKPGAGYSAEKTFDVTDGAVVSYDIDWYFGNAVARDGSFEYLQIGDKLRLGWTNGYKMFLSTDGGGTYSENAVFTGGNAIYTKNVSAQFDTESKTVKLMLDGKLIYSGVYSDPDGNTAAGADKVKFGFSRAGAPPDWAVPNGIARIRVAQFNEGEEEPDFSSMAITDITDDKVDVDYVLVSYNDESIRIFGALYDKDNNFVEAALSEDIVFEDPTKNVKEGSVSLTFTKNVKGYKLKVFAWNSLDGMIPVLASIKLDTPESTETPTQPPETPTEPPAETPESTETPTEPPAETPESTETPTEPPADTPETPETSETPETPIQ